MVGREVTSELGARRRSKIGHFLGRKVEKGHLDAEARDAAVGTVRDDHCGRDLAAATSSSRRSSRSSSRSGRSSPSSRRMCRADAVLATNTSVLSVTEIAAATSSPGRVVGMHFFNPAPLMPLVEVVRAELSDDAAVETAFRVAERMGKTPIRCHDTPGFVVNRVLIPLLNDCLRTLDEARVTPEDLDAAMRAGAGWPMGPCALVDLVGIDVHVHAAKRCTRGCASREWRRRRGSSRWGRRSARPQVWPRVLHVRLGSGVGSRPVGAPSARRAGRRPPERTCPGPAPRTARPRTRSRRAARVVRAAHDCERGEQDRHGALQPAPDDESALAPVSSIGTSSGPTTSGADDEPGATASRARATRGRRRRSAQGRW